MFRASQFYKGKKKIINGALMHIERIYNEHVSCCLQVNFLT